MSVSIHSPQTQTAWPGENNYALLRVYAYYRTFLSSLFLLMFVGGWAGSILGTYNPQLFLYTSLIYTALNTLTLIALWRIRFSPRQEQLFLLLFIDTVAITLLMHASGGTESGLGFLLLVSVASGSIFLIRQISLLLAALASLLVISESIYIANRISTSSQSLFAAGMLGVLLFITAMIFRHLTDRLQASHRETEYQAEQAAHLQQLTQQIVERMNTGIIVVDGHDTILLINQAARRLLGIPYRESPRQLLAEIDDQLQIWKRFPHTRSPFIRLADEGPEVRINFARLGDTTDADILIFIEDNRQLSQQAQQLKLASLGRLTASIAHEVRNPLGAISHASQLLAEAEGLDKADLRLTEIIGTHSKRVNQIIENVLQLSRRRPTEAETLDLGVWLTTFEEEYCRGHDYKPQITINLEQPDLKSKADPGQLHQVLTNLCDNGLRYSLEQTNEPVLHLHAGITPLTGLPFIDVIDEGPGLSEDQLDHVFEPFYTSDPSGSGLGLYICKELCEANEATLTFRRSEEGKSCFRINLAHKNRVFN